MGSVDNQLPMRGSNNSTSEKNSTPLPPPSANIVSYMDAPAIDPFFLFKQGRWIHRLLKGLYDSTANKSVSYFTFTIMKFKWYEFIVNEVFIPVSYHTPS